VRARQLTGRSRTCEHRFDRHAEPFDITSVDVDASTTQNLGQLSPGATKYLGDICRTIEREGGATSLYANGIDEISMAYKLGGG